MIAAMPYFRMKMLRDYAGIKSRIEALLDLHRAVKRFFGHRISLKMRAA